MKTPEMIFAGFENMTNANRNFYADFVFVGHGFI